MFKTVLRLLTIVAAGALAFTTIAFFTSLAIILMQVFGFIPQVA